MNDNDIAPVKVKGMNATHMPHRNHNKTVQQKPIYRLFYIHNW